MPDQPRGRREPEGWLLRIRTIGPGKVRPRGDRPAGRPAGRDKPRGRTDRDDRPDRGKSANRADRDAGPERSKQGAPDKRDARKHRRADARLIGAVLDEPGRKGVAAALKALVNAYPFGMLAGSVGAQDVDLVLKCPATDLTLIADLVKRRLMPAVREAGLGGRFWRKGFLRRALGTQGDVRRALVQTPHGRPHPPQRADRPGPARRKSRSKDAAARHAY